MNTLQIPLNQENIEILTTFFELKDGKFVYSKEKALKALRGEG